MEEQIKTRFIKQNVLYKKHDHNVPHSSLFILLVWWHLGREVYRVIIQDEFLKSYKSSTGFTYNYLEFC